MRTLDINEVQSISGGFEPVMILSFVAGAQDLSLTKTVVFSGLFYGAIGGGLGFGVGAVASLFGVSSGLTGAVVGTSAGAAFGAIDSLLSYGFGNYFFSKSEPQVAA